MRSLFVNFMEGSSWGDSLGLPFIPHRESCCMRRLHHVEITLTL